MGKVFRLEGKESELITFLEKEGFKFDIPNAEIIENGRYVGHIGREAMPKYVASHGSERLTKILEEYKPK